MKFPFFYTKLLFLSFIVGILIFYILYNTNISKFIGGLNNKLYLYSALLCTVGFLVTFYYIIIKDDFTKDEVDNIFIGIMIIIKYTILWIISSYYNNKFFNILFLFILCIGNYYLLDTMLRINETKYILLKKISNISISYILFHHIFIDLILWNYYN
jgi:hypothetical protein